jgi:glutathione S-transferase
MAVDFYYGSGSPYAWRVRLALEHKGVSFNLKTMSFAAGDLKTAQYAALNPRRRVPVLVDEDFVLYESAAIVEYIEERWSAGPPLFADNVRERATQRRHVREADQYLARFIERTATDGVTDEVRSDLRHELDYWETVIAGDDGDGALSAVDFTLYPLIALLSRIANRTPGFDFATSCGPRLAAWQDRMRALPVVQSTWPPHWK